jgi:enoyl-CoA hydratase/carnithine racemase
MAGHIRVEKEGALGWLVFDHPERRNAISAEMWGEIPKAIAGMDADPEVRVIVLRGEGEVAFVSGADISQFQERRTGSDASQDYEAGNARAFVSLATAEKPLLAMIHGFCVGGGCALALNADLRFAADDAVFAIPAARLGLGYPMLGIKALLDLVGPSRAKEMFFTARRFDATEALEMGLVNAVLPKADLEAHVRGVAEQIATNAPLTVKAVKRAIVELSKDPEHRDHDSASELVRACFDSEDYKEGVRAFLEKRRPRFQGR